MFQVGDRAMTRTDADIVEKYAGLICTVVAEEDNGWLEVIFDDDPNGDCERSYCVGSGSLAHIAPDFQIDEEAIAAFIDEM